MDLKKIQAALKKLNLAGWLFYDFKKSDPLAYSILGLDINVHITRRWFYFVPARGEPVKFVSSVEPGRLASLPGKTLIFRSWKELHEHLGSNIPHSVPIAMQYSPMAEIPAISKVDAGTMEMLRSLGITPVPGADLIQIFEACIDEKGYRSHLRAAKMVEKVKNGAFAEIGKRIKAKRKVTEFEMRKWIEREFKKAGYTSDGAPMIVAVNEHAADPHFEPTKKDTREIKKGDFVLLDIWAREDTAKGIYADITWCGYVGDAPRPAYAKAFDVIMRARDAGVSLIEEKFAEGLVCCGCEVDEAVYNVIEKAGMAKYIAHRTGHSIGHEVHGNGVFIDNMESRDSRTLMPGVCFSVEPGLYSKGEFGVRTEIDVFIRLDGTPEVTTKMQKKLVRIDQ